MAGGLFGGGAQPAATQTVTNTSEPWQAQKDILTSQVFPRAVSLSQTPQQYFPGSTVVPFSGQTNQALDQIQNLSGDQNSSVNGANHLLTNTLNGNYLYNNPQSDRAVQATLNRILPDIQSRFITAGHTGDSLNKDNTIAQTVADTYANQYDQERQRQMQAAVLAPQINQAQYYNPQQLLNAGNIHEQYNAQQLQDQINRFNFNQQEPINQLATLNKMIQGNYGGTSTQATPLYRNQTAGAVGGASAGASLANTLGFSPMLGAGLGLLGGLLF
jgi:hypothetical protein